MKPFLLLLITFITISANAQQYMSHHGMTAGDYQNKFNIYKNQGYRLVQIDGYAVGNTAYYAAIWKKVNGPAYYSHHAMTPEDYQNKFNTYKNQGYRLIQVDGYTIGNSVYYAAIWEQSPGDYKAHHGMTAADYQQKFDAYKQQGYHVSWVSGFAVGNTAYFAAIWEKKPNPDYYTHHVMSAADYQNKFNTYAARGYRLKMVSAYNIGNTDYYAAIWEKKNTPMWTARHRMTAMGYQNEFDNHAYSGYNLAQISGYAMNGQARYAAIWESNGTWTDADLTHIDKTVLDFMKRFDVPGTSIAIAKNGKLLFAKGYGVMDKSTGEAPGPNTLFRVASVSKPITSVTIMKMIQDNKFKITDKVFGTGALLGTDYGSQPYSAWEKEISVQNLLEHTAGGNNWDNDGDDGTSDPMFDMVSYNHKDLIGWILDTRDPEKKPGDKNDYSNFGYCVLGRIIEKKSGQSYESYVRNNVLNLCGITDMYIGADAKSSSRHNEAVYYDSNFDPYAMKVKRMDSHGGWIASSLDLVRFLVKADGFASPPDILNTTNFTTMTTPCAVASGYAKGWAVNGTNYFHTGGFPGGGSIIVRTGNGYTWAFLMNATMQNAADGMMWDIVNGIRNWPSINLF